MATLEQQRAQDAWGCGAAAQQRLGSSYGKYVNLAKGLPALIMNSGLMQVVAFLHEKSLDSQRRPKPDDHHTWLGQHLRHAIHKRFSAIPEDFEGFMEELMETSPRDYQAINSEAFAWLRWMRQMAAARKGVD